MKVQVFIRLKAGVLDVQGKAVERGINGLGIKDVANVRVGKLIEMELESTDKAAAQKEVEEICRAFLANTVIESYEVKIAE